MYFYVFKSGLIINFTAMNVIYIFAEHTIKLNEIAL